MPAKPQASDVIALTGTEQSESVVSQIIDDAALIASECIAGYDEYRQRSILKWLAAHLLASTQEDGVRTSERLGDAQDQFARAKMGDSLKGTTYGQQAIALDTNGCLARLGRAKARLRVV